MRKQILIATMILSSILSVPTYAATITAGAGQSTSASSEQAQSAEQKTESNAKSDAQQSESEAQSNGITWLVPRGLTSGEYMRDYGTTQWDWAEGVAQVRKWAQENKDGIPDTTDQKAQYEAIVKKVCDFLTYDEVYYAPHIAYTIRDGRGVCADYVALTRGLCDVYNIQCIVLNGSIEGGDHGMVKVVLNGQTYYSDPTNYDAGSAPMLTDSLPSYFTLYNECDANTTGCEYTGGDVDNDYGVRDIEARKQGRVLLGSGVDGDVYGSEEDAIALDKAFEANDMYTVYMIMDKYGI